jgi:hypothetical protein
VLLGALCAAAFAPTLAAAAPPAAADAHFKYRHAQKQIEPQRKDPFADIPKGPLQLIISTDEQKLHLYSDGKEVAETPIATGMPAHPTPMGAFSVIQKSRDHRSTIYSGAPMPYMQRLTWSGVALHEGVGVGHPVSHGCIRVPHEFATRLWTLTKLGARVIIARPELRPEPFADPHLFVRQEKPADPIPTAEPGAAKIVKTAETVDAAKSTDAPGGGDKDAAALATVLRAADLSPNAREAPQMSAPAAQPAPVRISHAAAEAPIAIFVSRKDHKIYVRQNFVPLFDAPITIEHPQQRLGTHIFTALEFSDDRSGMRWNVVSLPAEQAKPPRQYDKRADTHPRANRRDERTAAAPAEPPPTPQQALARIDIPPDTIDRIAQMIVPGSSLIVSDQSLGDETGEGTDFIVVTP